MLDDSALCDASQANGGTLGQLVLPYASTFDPDAYTNCLKIRGCSLGLVLAFGGRKMAIHGYGGSCMAPWSADLL